MNIKTVGICGSAGTMGIGIAMVAARAGYKTICHDLSEDRLREAMETARIFFNKSVERNRMTAEQAESAIQNLQPVTDLAALKDCDLIIEAVFEDLEVKQQLFKDLNDICKEQTIFGTNTSTLSIAEIAHGCGREDKVVGMHFCLPAQLMRLVEMSKGLNTSDGAFEAAWQWTISCNQHPVETKDTPGFILNALVVPFNNDVLRLIDAGTAEPEHIDKAIKTALGYKMGPCTLLDLIGLDTQQRLGVAFYDITTDFRCSVPPIVRRMVAANRLGRKTGQGLLRNDFQEPDWVTDVSYHIDNPTSSPVFGHDDPFVKNAHGPENASVTIFFGGAFKETPDQKVILVELGNECLEAHLDPQKIEQFTNVIGFARYKNGSDTPTDLIEIVKLEHTDNDALILARSVFENLGLHTVVCADRPGRIVNRLVRPKYNDALALVDAGVSTASALDEICVMGLGYPIGPIQRITQGGLENHYEVCTSLYQQTHDAALAPHRKAVVAHEFYKKENK